MIRKSVVIYLLLLEILWISGCAGGGGTVHHPPKIIEAGKPTVLRLELSVWGSGWGDMRDRFTSVTCHYRLVGEARFKSISMKAVSVESDRMFMECTLPSFEREAGTAVEYYFDKKFDGHYGRRATETVPLQ